MPTSHSQCEVHPQRSDPLQLGILLTYIPRTGIKEIETHSERTHDVQLLCNCGLSAAEQRLRMMMQMMAMVMPQLAMAGRRIWSKNLLLPPHSMLSRCCGLGIGSGLGLPRQHGMVMHMHRAMASGKRGEREHKELSVFEEWLAANPLPGANPHEEETIIVNGNAKLMLLHDEDEEVEEGLLGEGLGSDGMELWVDSLGRQQKIASSTSGRHEFGHDDGIWSSIENKKKQQPQWNGKYSWQDTASVFYECLRECGQMVWDDKHKCFVQVSSRDGTELLTFVPPLFQLPKHAACTPSEYLNSLRQNQDVGNQSKLLLALVSSSAAALGIFEDDSLVLHKVITAYTVRAKQGKAQLHYLRQGGPGRMSVGGGIRARETARLFSSICEKLDEWKGEIESCKLLFYSGNMRVWNEVYASNDPRIPVARDDIRWRKVPYSVRQPRLRELQRVYYGLSHGAVGRGVS